MCEFEEHDLPHDECDICATGIVEHHQPELKETRKHALDRHVKMHEGGTLPFADAILCDLGLLKGCGYESQR